MSKHVTEPARQVPVTEQYDVVVVGGGIAGVAAALAAARNGARVGLVEKENGLGGLATLGNVVIYLPLCDGRGNQVIGGLGEELLVRSVRDVKVDRKRCEFRPVPDCWKPDGNVELRSKERYQASYNPFSFQIEMEAMLAEAGVELWYDTRFCGCLTESQRITHIVVENKDGRTAMACRSVVDASGDADVCAAAGERTESLRTNVVCGWHYLLEDGSLTIRTISKRFDSYCREEGSEGPLFAGDRARDVTQHVLQTRAWIRQQVEERRAAKPEMEIYPFALASIPCFRMTRRLQAEFSLQEAHCHTWLDDCVGLTGDWRKNGPVYCLPYRSLRGDRICNLFAAGRCMSSDTTAWDMSRVIPTCAVTGEATGVAACMAALEHDGDAHAVNIPRLQERLRKQGVILDRKLVSNN